MEQWFPEREFFMRSQGQVRFIKISSALQKRSAALAIILALAVIISMSVMSFLQYRSSLERVSLLEREAEVMTSEERLQAYRDNLGEVTQDLEKRQDFIEEMMKVMPADVVRQSAQGEESAQTDELVEKVSTAVPEAAALAKIEARQLAFVKGLTAYADRRSKRAMWALSELGLDPKQMLASAEREARGGPFEELFGGDTIDPRFERLGLSLSRMAMLEATLDGVPQLRPTDTPAANSSYGYRRDPFTGRAAMHRGLDFRGPMGAPIYATARGTVTFVGRKGGYGNIVEISHGRGLLTRYAHMSRFEAKVGDRVEAGTVIGAIGSTGRSTGPHLHFEVRVNGTAVNPRTFLELAPDVLKKARRTPGSQRAAEAHDSEGGPSV
ncbi:MAG: peptidoglycan DD-metalloendopeptidase family protein [Erythrobacter sp.]|nr:peptidoglycan DD-metalloendopeptidase family protein [Erythrobacter sp.]NCQ63518.1 peptidoglycan DD-metalloendopeptidase family protein [Alphaproteobacteria bacterium]